MHHEVSSPALYQDLAHLMNAPPDRYRVLGDADMVAVISISSDDTAVDIQVVFEGLACEKIGSVLINDVVDCKSETGAPADCLSAMTVKSLVSGVTLGK